MKFKTFFSGLILLLAFCSGAFSQQYARPNTDGSQGNSFQKFPGGSFSNLYQAIDETTLDDSDYFYGTVDGDAYAPTLSSVTDPLSSSGHIIRIRASAVSSSDSYIDVRLYQGVSIKASFATPFLSSSFQTYTYTLTSVEADSITNYGALLLFVQVTNPTSDEIRVSWAEFQVPSASNAGGKFLILFGFIIKSPFPQDKTLFLPRYYFFAS